MTEQPEAASIYRPLPGQCFPAVWDVVGGGAGLSSDESGLANLAETVAQLDQTASRETENATQQARTDADGLNSCFIYMSD